MLQNTSVFKAKTHPLIEAQPGDILDDVLHKLYEHNSVAVVDTSGHFQGIVSRRDAVQAILTYNK